MSSFSSIDTQLELQQKIQRLWQRHRPQVLERIATLEAAALVQPPLDAVALEESICVAHNLAGSLGMYGFGEGSRVALELEVELRAESLDHGRLRHLVARLRRSID